MSPASRAQLVKRGVVSQGSQSLALGLAKTVPMNRNSTSLFACSSGFPGKAPVA